jgi:hypothetical protein
VSYELVGPYATIKVFGCFLSVTQVTLEASRPKHQKTSEDSGRGISKI